MNLNYIYLTVLLIIAILVYINLNSNTPEIQAASASKLINDENHIFLDVRTDSEYNSGHIKNSYHIPLQSLQDRLDEIETIKNKNIIVYCRSGARSSKATKFLSQNGFRVRNLVGGVLSWDGKLVK